MKTNPNFDLDKLPEDYYDELKIGGWLEDSTIIYVTVDEFETATTVLKDRNDIIILRQFRLADKIGFSVDVQTEFSQI